jgi:drug/metabolite transporter (DMT)-like permease
MTVAFAVLAAFANAVVVVAQHKASTSAPKETTGLRLVGYLVHNPLWLLGWIALIAAFVFQALALHNGELSVVQPLLVVELVFALVLRQLWLRQSIALYAWVSAAVICAGLAVFVATAEPRGGGTTPSAADWVGVVVACGGAAAVLAVLAQRGSPIWRAALFGTAAAIVWALEATFIKTATDTITQHGIGGAFAHWPIYAMAVGGIAGVVLEQAALHVGPISVSQPLMVIVDPVVSIALGVWLFREQFTHDPVVLAVAAVSFVAVGIGVVGLVRTAPETVGQPT